MREAAPFMLAVPASYQEDWRSGAQWLERALARGEGPVLEDVTGALRAAVAAAADACHDPDPAVCWRRSHWFVAGWMSRWFVVGESVFPFSAVGQIAVTQPEMGDRFEVDLVIEIPSNGRSLEVETWRWDGEALSYLPSGRKEQSADDAIDERRGGVRTRYRYAFPLEKGSAPVILMVRLQSFREADRLLGVYELREGGAVALHEQDIALSGVSPLMRIPAQERASRADERVRAALAALVQGWYETPPRDALAQLHAAAGEVMRREFPDLRRAGVGAALVVQIVAEVVTPFLPRLAELEAAPPES